MIIGSKNFNPDFLQFEFENLHDEIKMCRNDVALFDFSFVKTIHLSGKNSLDLIERFTTRNLSKMLPGQIRYTIHCSNDGYVVSDQTIWQLDESNYFLMTGNIQDLKQLYFIKKKFKLSEVKIKQKKLNVIAIQGPNSLKILENIVNAPQLMKLKYYEFTETSIFGADCYVGRLGYTGERGFEFVMNEKRFNLFWENFSKLVKPAGFGAINCLRIEAGFILFTNELIMDVRPHEIGLEKFSKIKTTGLNRKLISFSVKMNLDSIFWKPNYSPPTRIKPNELLVSSACFSPHANKVIGLGYINSQDFDKHAQFDGIPDYFGKLTPIERPYYDPQKKRPIGSWNTDLLNRSS